MCLSLCRVRYNIILRVDSLCDKITCLDNRAVARLRACFVWLILEIVRDWSNIGNSLSLSFVVYIQSNIYEFPNETHIPYPSRTSWEIQLIILSRPVNFVKLLFLRQSFHEVSEHIDRQREHDGRILFGRYCVQCLKLINYRVFNVQN